MRFPRRKILCQASQPQSKEKMNEVPVTSAGILILDTSVNVAEEDVVTFVIRCQLLNDNICTECFEEDEEKKNPLPGKTGQVLNPLKKKRRRTMNHPIPVVTLAKKSRGRPRKFPSKTSEKIVDLVKDATNSETVDVNDNIATGEGRS